MQVIVMNKRDAKKETYKLSAPKTALISIANFNDNDNVFAHRDWLCAVLKLKFDDVESNESGCISAEDAASVVHFINRIKDKTDRLIVQCEAGVSRSAGVAAAIMKFIEGDDSLIFNNEQFRPNMTCYKKVLSAFTARE